MDSTDEGDRSVKKGQAKVSSDTARFVILSLIYQATWKGFPENSHPADREAASCSASRRTPALNGPQHC